ncbi:unnamed protein product, partial [Mesorhabditis belari]|uniref:Hypoxia up-regulated protein 1 n=1 Tax=Mesorhabditis belari TaxID=2138241 RepID=A0AAF3FKU7_9BILA
MEFQLFDSKNNVSQGNCPLHNDDPYSWILNLLEGLLALTGLALNCPLIAVTHTISTIPLTQKRFLTSQIINFVFLSAFQLARSIYLLLAIYSPCLNLVNTINCKLQEFPLLFFYVHSALLVLIVALQTIPRYNAKINKHDFLSTSCSVWQACVIISAAAITLFFTAFDTDLEAETMTKCSLLLAVRETELAFLLITALISLYTVAVATISIVATNRLGEKTRSTNLLFALKDVLLPESVAWQISLIASGAVILYRYVFVIDCIACVNSLLELSFILLPLIITVMHPILTIWNIPAFRDAVSLVFPVIGNVLPEYQPIPELPRSQSHLPCTPKIFQYRPNLNKKATIRLEIPMSSLRWIVGATILAFYCLQTEAALAAMSIDLGSQFIKIGLVKPGIPMEIVLNKESRRKTPNIVSIRNNERLFADAAAALAIKYPKSAYTYLLDLIGKKDGASSVESYKKRFPFAAIQFDEERGTVSFPSESEVYNVETLLAMILWHCKQDTQAYAGQTVKDVVITVPVFFNQAERRALAAAAKIAGLNLLQLLNDGSAAALNYGVFRRKEITEQAQTMLIYDMGASKTTATLVEYLLEEDKVKKEKNPVVRTIGVGFDRTLGGLEMTLRLQKHLEEIFRKTIKADTDIATNPRSMAKLFKEAERVKQVLSANVDHYAQIESVHEDRDFKAKVSREELEGLIADLEPRFLQPINDALEMADFTIDKVDQIVLLGAATRTPKVQAAIQKILNGKELGRFLNTDEAIALGASYQAAHLSKAFRALPFGVQEIQLYPIQVSFLSKNETTGEEKQVSRTLFGAKTHYPAPRKTVSMTSYNDDFTISLNYGSVPGLNKEQEEAYGARDLASVAIGGVAEAIKSHTAEEGAVFKGVKAQFYLDQSGIVSVTKAHAIIELPPVIETEPTIAPKIEEETNKETKNEDQASEEKLEKEEPRKDEEKKDDTEAKDTEEVKAKNTTIKEPPKPRSVKADLTVKVEEKDLKPLSEHATHFAIEILAAFEKKESEKLEREAAMNGLEALVYDLAVKVEDGEEFAEYCTDEEKQKIREEAARLRTWMEDETDINTKTEEFVANKKILDDLAAKPNKRKKERLELPKAVEALDNMLNQSHFFIDSADNLTATTLDDPVFTIVELDVLRKMITDTETWWTEKQELYVKQQKNEDSVVTVKELSLKIRDLDREVKYLLNKLKFHVPKKNDEKKEEKKEETIGENDGEEKNADGEKKDEKIVDEELKEKTDETIETQEPEKDKKPHDPAEF